MSNYVWKQVTPYRATLKIKGLTITLISCVHTDKKPELFVLNCGHLGFINSQITVDNWDDAKKETLIRVHCRLNTLSGEVLRMHRMYRTDGGRV